MARIRSIKPEFFIDEELQDLEMENPGAYCMLVYAGLWTVADREGRFEWRPRRLRLSILPFLKFEIETTLDLLMDAGYLVKYEIEGRNYGFVKNWSRHQIVPRDEPQSEIPAPDGLVTPYFRPATQSQRLNIYQEDNYTCQYCGDDLRHKPRAICLDHVVPYAQGGTNRTENLTTSCKSCNAKKAAMTPGEAGLPWPKGKGEKIVDGIIVACAVANTTQTDARRVVTGGLTGSQWVPDKEGEGEKEKEKEPTTSVGEGGVVDTARVCEEPPPPCSAIEVKGSVEGEEIERQVVRIKDLHLRTCGLSTLPPLAVVRQILMRGIAPELIDDIYQAHGGDVPKYRQRNIVERLQALRDGREDQRAPPGRRARDRLSAEQRRQEGWFQAARDFVGKGLADGGSG